MPSFKITGSHRDGHARHFKVHNGPDDTHYLLSNNIPIPHEASLSDVRTILDDNGINPNDSVFLDTPGHPILEDREHNTQFHAILSPDHEEPLRILTPNTTKPESALKSSVQSNKGTAGINAALLDESECALVVSTGVSAICFRISDDCPVE